jgi:hypothetical protein
MVTSERSRRRRAGCGIRLVKRWPFGYIPAMKPKCLLLSLLFIFFVLATTGVAENTIDLQPNDTIQSVLQRQIGQPVELRMKSGEKLGGKLEKLNDKMVHLTQLTGAEYFDAVVAMENIGAVVVRAKAK